MHKLWLLKIVVITLNLCLCFGIFTPTVFAVMSSSNYQIWADTVSIGGNRSTSTSFGVDDTIGEGATSINQLSTNFYMSAGLPAIFQEPVLTFSVSDNTLSLSPELSVLNVSTGTYTLNVTTNAKFGYTVQVTEDGNLRTASADVNDVADGTVTAGSEEYGISVSGVDAAFGDDEAISTTSLVVASRTNWTTGSVTTVTHKASVINSLPVGSYSHVVTYTVIGNF